MAFTFSTCIWLTQVKNRLLPLGLLLSRPQQQTRSYAFKSDLKIKWIRPEKVSCIKPEKSGDLKALPLIDQTQYPIEFYNSKELQDADRLVKKVFSLEFATRKRTMEIARLGIVDSVKRHALDKGSTEARIASMTGEILNLQQHMGWFPRDKRTKVRLKELIDKRHKFVKHLRQWDYKRFEWLLEKLDLVYKAPPSEYTWITRKMSLRKLTDKHCDDVRSERLVSYRAALDAQKLVFLQRKADTLQWIQDEEQACGMEPTVRPEQVQAVREQIRKLQDDSTPTVGA